MDSHNSYRGIVEVEVKPEERFDFAVTFINAYGPNWEADSGGLPSYFRITSKLVPTLTMTLCGPSIGDSFQERRRLCAYTYAAARASALLDFDFRLEPRRDLRPYPLVGLQSLLLPLIVVPYLLPKVQEAVGHIRDKLIPHVIDVPRLDGDVLGLDVEVKAGQLASKHAIFFSHAIIRRNHEDRLRNGLARRIPWAQQRVLEILAHGKVCPAIHGQDGRQRVDLSPGRLLGRADPETSHEIDKRVEADDSMDAILHTGQLRQRERHVAARREPHQGHLGRIEMKLGDELGVGERAVNEAGQIVDGDWKAGRRSK